MHSALAFLHSTGGAAWRMQMQAVVGQRSGDPAHQLHRLLGWETRGGAPSRVRVGLGVSALPVGKERCVRSRTNAAVCSAGSEGCC
jgi:hypothetical protein